MPCEYIKCRYHGTPACPQRKAALQQCFEKETEADKGHAVLSNSTDWLNAVVDEADKLHKESVAVIKDNQSTQEERWTASLRADTSRTLITILERVKTAGI